ncbi:hypothetical protein [Actinacidiphila acidipaludis]|uniref:Uncharacterized protein n=1 Tax=Actinacidiphila acidipaludis TaxID=2873382 RepID=A0ABS7Q8I6_9ACTN|nr:hypothetical protein [Streptomyces acidipaludis]MBY8879019.1 hypothetical protein [Streptomyces acidipaludis]
MTQEDAGDRQIHIRLEGGGARDLGALHRWLSREDWFAQAQREHGLRVAYREENGTERPAGPDGPPMGGLITELVLVVASSAMTPVFEDLYTRAKAAVRAWADNSGARRPRVAATNTDPAAGAAGRTADDDAADPSDDGTDDGEAGRIR